MTDTANPPPAPKPAARTGRIALAVLCAAALAGGSVLYGIKARGGKEAAGGQCAASAAVAARTAAFAKGEVAALSVAKTPRPMAELSFDADGGKRKFSDFRGKTVLLNLWATWCIPCREEMPALDRLQARLGGPDFEVVAVSIDTTRLEKRQAFLNEAGVKSLGFYADPSAEVFQVLKKAGKVVGLPTSILVDRDGCEIGVMSGPADWASADALALVAAAAGR
jgi:thiol-disulfide isomerase/thioredoxin